MLNKFNVRPTILLLPSKRKIEHTLYSTYIISLYRVGRDVPSSMLMCQKHVNVYILVNKDCLLSMICSKD